MVWSWRKHKLSEDRRKADLKGGQVMPRLIEWIGSSSFEIINRFSFFSTNNKSHTSLLGVETPWSITVQQSKRPFESSVPCLRSCTSNSSMEIPHYYPAMENFRSRHFAHPCAVDAAKPILIRMPCNAILTAYSASTIVTQHEGQLFACISRCNAAFQHWHFKLRLCLAGVHWSLEIRQVGRGVRRSTRSEPCYSSIGWFGSWWQQMANCESRRKRWCQTSSNKIKLICLGKSLVRMLG